MMMKTLAFANALALISLFQSDDWKKEVHAKYTLHYSKPDESDRSAYGRLIEAGIESVESFFGRPYQSQVNVFIQPNRQSLDAQWQQDWGMPDFKSECWMVASGVATRLDLLSPARWSSEACEHAYSDGEKTARLFMHELVHVYHGQYNVSPDFSDTERIDWFVEGLATYASGQCDAERLTQVKTLLSGNKLPESLDQFWSGKYKYGLSGSVVMFIDQRYGRDKLKSLLPYNRKHDLLDALQIAEEDLLVEWKSFIESL